MRSENDLAESSPAASPARRLRDAFDALIEVPFAERSAWLESNIADAAQRTELAKLVEAEIIPLEPISDLELKVLPVAEDAAKWRQRAMSAVARGKDLEGRLAAISSEIAEWRRRALIAEALLRKGRPTQATADNRFRRLRTLLAKELHPDHASTRTVERAELFKVLWPEIEAIERLPHG